METTKSKTARGVRAITNKKTPKIVVVKDDVRNGTQSLRNGTQSLYAERIVRVGDLKLRAEVKRDAYDFQSYARVSAWTTKEGWEIVTTIPFEKTLLKASVAYALAPLTDFAADARPVLDALVQLGIDTLA